MFTLCSLLANQFQLRYQILKISFCIKSHATVHFEEYAKKKIWNTTINIPAKWINVEYVFEPFFKEYSTQ